MAKNHIWKFDIGLIGDFLNFKPPLKNLYAVRVSHFIVNTLSARRYLPHFIKVFFNRLVRTEGHLCDNSVQLVEEILFSLIIFIHCYDLLYCVNDYAIIFLYVKQWMSHGTCTGISKIRNNLKVSSHMIKNSCQVFCL